METVTIKNALNRPRVFSVVDPEGNADAVRMRSGATVNVDVRLLTPEIVANIEEGGHLLLLGGRLPAKLNPYPEKNGSSGKADAPDEGDGPFDDEGDGGKKVPFKKGVKN